MAGGAMSTIPADGCSPRRISRRATGTEPHSQTGIAKPAAAAAGTCTGAGSRFSRAKDRPGTQTAMAAAAVAPSRMNGSASTTIDVKMTPNVASVSLSATPAVRARTTARAALGLLVAVLAGWFIGRRGEPLLRSRQAEGEERRHDHGEPGSSGRRFVEHLCSDFVFMGRFVVLGAAVAALLQTVVPQEALSTVADAPVVGVLALMGLAVLLSLCSEADAFVAVSFTAFSPGSQLAFLVLGPVVDAKLAVLYGATFRRGFLLRVLAAAAPVAVAGALVFDALW
jgi:Predicted permease